MTKDSIFSFREALNRRQLLKGLGATALGVGLGGLAAGKAQDAPMGELPLAVERFAVGDSALVIIKEASPTLQPDMFGVGAPEGAVSELLGEFNLPTDSVAASVNVILVEQAGELTLLDTGTGGTIVAALEALGVAPVDVTKVILTHWHGDHVGGVSTEGSLNFPNAAHHFPQADWDFLQSAPADNDSAQGALAKLQPAVDAGQLEFYADAQDFGSGLSAVAAIGHTPGHHAIRVSSGESQLLFTSDAANHPLVALQHPEWGFSFDADPAQATETRRELFGRAADEGLQILAYHFPFPGSGYIVREGEGFRFLPSTA